jgi:hypothetical protein
MGDLANAFPIRRAEALALTLTANPLQKCWMVQASTLGLAADQWPDVLLLEGNNQQAELLRHRRVVDDDCHLYTGCDTCLHVFAG